MITLKKKHFSSSQIIILGFASAILLGTLLLMLPISSRSGNFTSFSDAIFTATSAVCVTGLVVHDTATYWSAFGQFVILLLIQAGGLGIFTVAVTTVMLSGKRIDLMQRSTMQESISAMKFGGIVKLTRFILKITFIIEFLGAVAMMPVFCKDFGANGIWISIFHSISAFCNAGFDLTGSTAPFSSLTAYAANPLVNIIIILLIVIGGIGFFVWDDIRTNSIHLHKYHIQTKVVLSTTALLIILPSIYFFVYEFSQLPTANRVLSSVFQAVTPRTAGFNTIDLNSLSGIGKAITITLMLIGGSPGSTAGGMKTTTVALLFFSAISVFKRHEDVECFDRRISDSTIKNASAILLIYLVLFISGGLVISAVEGLPIGICLFETASAIGTVGLSLGITSNLSMISRSILIVLMFWGRVGGLTLIFATTSGSQKNLSKKPLGKLIVG